MRFKETFFKECGNLKESKQPSSMSETNLNKEEPSKACKLGGKFSRPCMYCTQFPLL